MLDKNNTLMLCYESWEVIFTLFLLSCCIINTRLGEILNKYGDLAKYFHF